MGAKDKLGNAAQDAAGKLKEGAGKATDNERLQAEGQAEQTEADVRKAAEKARDALK